MARAAFGRAVLAAFCVLLLAGCGSRGVSLEDVALDKSIVTGSIPQKAPVDQVSDETTVRNAVSAANLRQIGAAGLPWANSSTGSQGTVTAIFEVEQGGILCRKFTTSRESFRGVAIYTGEACRHPNGDWLMRSFVEG